MLEQFTITNVVARSASGWIITATTGPQVKNTENERTKSHLKSQLRDRKNSDNSREAMLANFKLEMDNLIKSATDHFIVHCIESNVSVESIPLQTAFEHCKDLPMCLIAKSNRKLRARCFVPDVS